jgi:RimJ/RimL family protein N-acetyltransferase
MADFAFQNLKATLLLAVCHPENAASAALMKRLDMRYRGVESWYERDLATYQITSDEWLRSPAAGRRPN